MKKYAVTLLNRDLGHSHPPRLVQDRNGLTIGRSKWNPEYGCHSLAEPLTIDQYNKVADRLAMCWHMAMMKWQPRFIEIDIPDTATESVGGAGSTTTVIGTRHTDNELCEMHHKTREKLARGLGINAGAFIGNSSGLVTAILEAEAAR